MDSDAIAEEGEVGENIKVHGGKSLKKRGCEAASSSPPQNSRFEAVDVTGER